MLNSKWQKSSVSLTQSTCVEVGVWKKSTESDASGPWCVEASGAVNGDVLVRDSKDPNGPVLCFSPDEWRAFIGGVMKGEFNLED
jgi:hypothetical protein